MTSTDHTEPTPPTPINPTITAKYELVVPSEKVKKTTRSPRLAKEGVQHFTDDVLDQFQKKLLGEREALLNQIKATREGALKRDEGENPEEDGTTAYLRNLDLHRADEQNQRIHAIDNAIRAIEGKTYGVCQDCKRLIDRKRLHAYPFAVRCVGCKGKHEEEVKASKRSHS